MDKIQMPSAAQRGIAAPIIILIAVVILGGITYFATRPSTEPQQETSKETAGTTTPVPETASQNGQKTPGAQETAVTHVVEMTSSGFVPASIEIKQGDTVEFVNNDARPRWPASAMHPTHTVYPGSDIKKCGTADEPTLFDACRGVPTGKSWSFTFGENGTWRYHDHLLPNFFGVVVVN